MKKLLKVKVAILMALFCMAFSTTTSANDLEGAWTLKSTDYMNMKDVVAYKIFHEDGTFINLMSHNDGETFSIPSKGRYKVQIAGIYLEELDPKYAQELGRNSVVITYKRDGNKLTIKFVLCDKTLTEVWKKTSTEERVLSLLVPIKK